MSRAGRVLNLSCPYIVAVCREILDAEAVEESKQLAADGRTMINSAGQRSAVAAAAAAFLSQIKLIARKSILQSLEGFVRHCRPAFGAPVRWLSCPIQDRPV